MQVLPVRWVGGGSPQRHARTVRCTGNSKLVVAVRANASGCVVIVCCHVMSSSFVAKSDTTP